MCHPRKHNQVTNSARLNNSLPLVAGTWITAALCQHPKVTEGVSLGTDDETATFWTIRSPDKPFLSSET